MKSYQSIFFGLRMEIPDGWEVQMWPDDGMEKFARDASSWKPTHTTTMCFQASRHLISARLNAPGSCIFCDAGIELKACVHTDDYFLTFNNAEPLKEWNVNSIQMLYCDDFHHGSPENMYYRFPRWKISPGLWLYASIMASGRARFEYVLSVFETLARVDSRPDTKNMRLYEREPWNVAPSLFRMAKMLNDDAALYDLALDSDVSRDALSTNQAILSGRTGNSTRKWTPITLRRKSGVRRADCYYGPQSLYSSGIFSTRAIEVLRPYMTNAFSVLPCTVNGKPHYFLSFGQGETCLDVKNSEINRFEDGRIMNIKRYRFKKELLADPLIFAIPEEECGIFTTVSIRSIVAEARLTGIAFYPVDGNGREYTYRG